MDDHSHGIFTYVEYFERIKHTLLAVVFEATTPYRHEPKVGVGLVTHTMPETGFLCHLILVFA